MLLDSLYFHMSQPRSPTRMISHKSHANKRYKINAVTKSSLRKKFKLPKGHLYVCFQGLFKLHPR